ncbi:alpha/beta fold hydrolase [Kitasatospora arboriphila]
MSLPSAPAAPENGTGTPIVLLHAFPLSARMWACQLERLPGPAGEAARVIVPDQRGFGSAPLGRDEPSLDAVADDVARLLDAARPGAGRRRRPVHGRLRRHGLRPPPRRAARRPAPRRHQGHPRHRSGPRQPRADRPRRRGPRQRADPRRREDRDRPARPRHRPGADRPRPRHDRRGPCAAVAWAQRAMAARGDSLEVLRGVRVPAAVIVGEADAVTPLAEARLMAEALPDAELTVIPSVGHLSSLEAPETFNAAVRALLRRVRG